MLLVSCVSVTFWWHTHIDMTRDKINDVLKEIMTGGLRWDTAYVQTCSRFCFEFLENVF